MRPNIEEIREQHELAILNESDDDVSRFMSVFHSVPALIAYIDELENMPLVQTVVKLQEENVRLQNALKSLGTPNHDYELEDVRDVRKQARRFLEGGTK